MGPSSMVVQKDGIKWNIRHLNNEEMGVVNNVGVSIHACRKSRDSIPEVTRHVSYVRVRRNRQRSLLRARVAKQQVEYTLVTCAPKYI